MLKSPQDWIQGTALLSSQSDDFKKLDFAAREYLKTMSISAHKRLQAAFDIWCKKSTVQRGWTWEKSDRNKRGTVTLLVKHAQLDKKYARMLRPSLHFFARQIMTDQQMSIDYMAMMCWNAAARFGFDAGILTREAYWALSDISYENYSSIISLNDNAANSVEELTRIPQGHFLCFFDKDNTHRISHVMVSLGDGFAAGNKNDCIGIGAPVGWEILDLRKLRWVLGSDYFDAPNNRRMIVRHKSMR